MKINVLNTQGQEVETLELDTKVFDGKVNMNLMNQAVVAYLANQRKGLACTKTRGEVSGGGKKLWKQKGTGRARMGSSRSPLWRHGGISFGPKPHSFYKDLPTKMKLMALKSALNAQLKDDQIVVLQDLKINSSKTKDFYKIIKDLKLDTVKTRFVVNEITPAMKKASRNIARSFIDQAVNLNTYDVLNCKKLVFTKEGLKQVEARITKCLK
jgi:large subunit ribosomal protein L4